MHIDAPSFYEDDETRYAESAGAPPAEALFALRVAGEVARQLYESGLELQFALAPSAARVEVLLCDVEGIALSRIAPAAVLDIATGAHVFGDAR